MISFVNPLLNQNIYNTVLAIKERGLLKDFYTTLTWKETNIGNKLLPSFVVKELRKRIWHKSLNNHIISYPSLELGRHIFNKLHLKFLTESDRIFSPHHIFENLDKKTANKLSIQINKPLAVYAYETGAYFSFLECERLGIKKIYDLPAPYWRFKKDFLEEEAIINPKWKNTLSTYGDSDWIKLKKDKELELADVIIVASNFVKKSITTYFPHYETKIKIFPYGASETKSKRSPGNNKKLKILYVGNLGQAKGISYFIDTINNVRDIVDCTIVGKKVIESQELNSFLTQHHYIESLPHSSILNLMAEHDVFLFPSLYEGFGLVLVEALSVGLPAITTENVGASDLIVNNKEGFIVPIRDTKTMEEKIRLLHKNRNLLNCLSMNAIDKAKNYQWTDFRKNISDFLFSYISNK